MSVFVVMDIGCIECGIPSRLLAVTDTEELAQSVALARTGGTHLAAPTLVYVGATLVGWTQRDSSHSVEVHRAP